MARTRDAVVFISDELTSVRFFGAGIVNLPTASGLCPQHCTSALALVILILGTVGLGACSGYKV